MPAPTVALWGEFVSTFPEFEDTPRTRVERFLVLAEENVNAAAWGDKRKQGVLYLTAHMLALAPTGEPARLESDRSKTTYGEHYDFLMRTVVSGFRVI